MLAPLDQQTVEQRESEAKTHWQTVFDESAERLGRRAPAPVIGLSQTANDYARGTAEVYKREFLLRDDPFYKIDYLTLAAQAFRTFVPQLLNQCEKQAENPMTVPVGEFRMLQRTDSQTGHKCNVFIGQDHFTKFMGRPGRRVTAFRAPLKDTYGRHLDIYNIDGRVVGPSR